MRTRHTRKQRGGESLPLITYTPHYREIEFTSEIKYGGYHNGVYFNYSGHYDINKYNVLQIKFKLSPVENIVYGVILNDFTRKRENIINILIDKSLNIEEIKENFSIIFAAECYKYYAHQSVQPQPIGFFFIDNKGNQYEIDATLPKGFQLPSLGIPYDTRSYFTNYETLLGPKNTILPDSMIDQIIEIEKTNKLGNFINRFSQSESAHNIMDNMYRKRYVLISPKTPEVEPIPHRAFEPTAELAEYIQGLEDAVKPNESASIKSWSTPSLSKLAANLAVNHARKNTNHLEEKKLLNQIHRSSKPHRV